MFKYLFLTICCIATVLNAQEFLCSPECKMEIVETIPEGMESSDSGHISTYASWLQLLELAEESIHIASYYWTLRDEATPAHPTSKNGTEILDKLFEIGQRGVDIKITKHLNEANFPNSDIDELIQANAATVRDVDIERLVGAGILHTKMWIVDRKHIYLGSANLDWRALTQVKELGIMVTNCPCVANDMGKTFDVYWAMGEDGSQLPVDEWNVEFESPYNAESPMQLESGGVQYNAFVTSAPPQFCPKNRTPDLDGILHIMQSAEEFIHIAVMDYFPLIMFDGPLKYWGVLDNMLRSAAIKGVKVKLLMAKWTNTRASAQMFLRSLENFNKAYTQVDIQVKMFVVPTNEDQASIPYARVNHNKYVVTEKSTHIGTSNWSGDYFLSTGGVGFVVTPNNATVNNNNIRQDVEDIFKRDWDSPYSKTLDDIYPPEEKSCPNLAHNMLSNLHCFNIFIVVFWGSNLSKIIY